MSGDSRTESAMDINKVDTTLKSSSETASVGGVRSNSAANVVGFMFGDEECRMDDLNEEEWERCEIKQDKERARHTGTRFLSVLYATMCILMGVVVPITEALTDQWQMSGVVTAFLLYMSGGSVVVLLYLLVELHLYRRDQDKPKLQMPDIKLQASIPEVRRQSALAKVSESSEVSAGQTSNPEDYQTVCMFQNNAFNSSDLVCYQRPIVTPPPPAAVNSTRRTSSVASDLFRLRVDPAESVSPKPHSSLPFDDTFSEIAVDRELMQFITVNTETASQAHEGTSFYLRFGFLMFAIAYIIFICLEIDYVYSEEYCSTNDEYAWVLFFHLAFVALQTFFLFKYQKLPLKNRKRMVRFSLMHIVATNFVVWIRALVSEIRGGTSGEGHYTQLEGNDTGNVTDCDPGVIHTAVTYLFPFILEYSLIAVATFMTMFMTLEIRVNGEVLNSIKRYMRHAKNKNASEGEPKEAHPSSMLDKSHSGVFLGILVFTVAIFSFIILEYKLNQDDPTSTVEAYIWYHSTDIFLHCVGLIAVVIGVFKIWGLRFSFLRSNFIDHILLFISLSGTILYDLFKAVCLFFTICNYTETSTEIILDVTSSLLILVQAICQTAFIMSGMSKYSARPEQREDKPGRGIITFLILTNLAIWFLMSFAEKDISIQTMEAFYGVVPWQIILHLTLPLLLFYRFHSSVCLADMWITIYQDEDSPIQYVDL